MIIGKKVRLELNNKQETLAKKHCGVARHAYNTFVTICKERYESNVKIPSAIDMHKELVKNVKSVNKWYYECSKFTPQEALRNLDRAYKNFHTKQKKHNYKLLKYRNIKGIRTCIGLEGLPQYKKKGQNDSFYLEKNITVKDNKIKVPKFGWLKCSEQLPDINIKNINISRVAGQWFVSFKYEKETFSTTKKEEFVGVDLGCKDLAVLSNGEYIKNLKPYRKYKKKLRKQQKECSRRLKVGAKNQSSNYKKSKAKVAKIHYKISCIRKDIIHKTTTYLAKNFDTICIEDLKVKNMVKNHNLASAITDGGFYEFKRQLLYKKEIYKGSVFVANTFYPTSKLCSVCKTKNEKLTLNDRKWTCSCGTHHNRDYNAAKNLEILAVSCTVSAFGDGSTGTKVLQLVDELGMKHQMFTFV